MQWNYINAQAATVRLVTYYFLARMFSSTPCSQWVAQLFCKAGFEPAVFRAFYVFRQMPIRQFLQDFLMCIESFYDRCTTLLAHDRQCFTSRARLALWTIHLGSSCPKPMFVKFLALKGLKLLTNQF